MAAQSDVDPRIVVCPAGDSLFRVIARGAGGDPEPQYTVKLDFCGCPGVRIGPPRAQEYSFYGDSCLPSVVGNHAGVSDFYLRAGGVCSGAQIQIDASGYPLGVRTFVASPDQNGDLIVDQSDMTLLSSKIGSSDPTADLDGDGQVTVTDRSIAEAHLGHSTQAAVGVENPPPGQFRLLPAWPNPSRGSSTTMLQLPKARTVNVDVLDSGGRSVRVLIRNQEMSPGTHGIAWDGHDALGSSMPAGVYYLCVRAGTDVGHTVVILLR